MAIIVIGSSKGGCGKSTICTNLTVLHLASEPDTLLVDADPQKSSSNWSAVREIKNRLPAALVMEKTGGDLSKSVLKIADKYPTIFVDVPGNNSPELRSSLVIADLLVMPLRPSNFDAWVFSRDMELVANTRITNPSLKVLVVMNGLSTSPSARHNEICDVSKYISDTNIEDITIAESYICHRAAYNQAVAQGASVTELASGGQSNERAKHELKSVYREIMSHI